MKSYKLYYLDQHRLKEPIKKYQPDKPKGVARYVIYLVNTIKKLQSQIPELSERFEDPEEGEKRKTTIVLLYKTLIEELYEIEADIQYFEDKEGVTFENKKNEQIKKFFRKLQREYEERKRQEILKKVRTRRRRRILQEEITPYTRNRSE